MSARGPEMRLDSKPRLAALAPRWRPLPGPRRRQIADPRAGPDRRCRREPADGRPSPRGGATRRAIPSIARSPAARPAAPGPVGQWRVPRQRPQRQPFPERDRQPRLCRRRERQSRAANCPPISRHGSTPAAAPPPARASIPAAAMMKPASPSCSARSTGRSGRMRAGGDALYRRVDLHRIAVMGHSCGGLQALAAGADPRIGDGDGLRQRRL